MEYYRLSVGEGKDALEFEEALKRIDYDVDDRASTWSKGDIDKIINTMTKENATKMILQFLPDPAFRISRTYQHTKSSLSLSSNFASILSFA